MEMAVARLCLWAGGHETPWAGWTERSVCAVLREPAAGGAAASMGGGDQHRRTLSARDGPAAACTRLPRARFLLRIWNCVHRSEDLFWPHQSSKCRELLSHTECLARGGPAEQAEPGSPRGGRAGGQGSSPSWAVLFVATSDRGDGPTSRAAPTLLVEAEHAWPLPADRAVATRLGESVGQNMTLLLGPDIPGRSHHALGEVVSNKPAQAAEVSKVGPAPGGREGGREDPHLAA